MARDPFDDEEDDFGAPPSPQVTGRQAFEQSVVGGAPEVPEAEPVEIPQEAAPESVPVPQLQGGGSGPDASVQAALAERQSLIEQPYEPVYHRAAVDPREEARILAQSQQMEAESFRERAGRRRQIERGLAAQGVEFETDAFGNKEIATHSDGSPRFKPAVVAPLEWDEQGRAVRRQRDEFGNVYPVDILKSGRLGKDYKRDDASGEFYAEGPSGPVWLGGRDEAYVRQRDLREVQDRAQAEQGVMGAQLSDLRLRMRDLKAQHGAAFAFPDDEGTNEETLAKAVQDAMAKTREAEESKDGAFSFIAGSSRKRRLESAQEAQKDAETKLAGFQAVREYEGMAQEARRLEGEMQRRKARAARAAMQLHALKYGLAGPEDDGVDVDEGREAFSARSGVAGDDVTGRAVYPESAIEPGTTEGEPGRVRADVLLERASAMAAHTGRSVSEMYPAAVREAREQGLQVPELPEDRPLYRVKSRGVISWGQNDPVQAVSQAVLNGDLEVPRGVEQIRKITAGPEKPRDNKVGALKDFAARAAIVTSNAVNGSLAGLARFVGADSLADWAGARQQVGQRELESGSLDLVNPSREGSFGAVAGEVVGELAGMAPAMAATGGLGGALRLAAPALKVAQIGTIAPRLAGILPMALQSAGSAYEAAFQKARAEGKGDEEAGEAGGRAMIDTLPGLALYAAAGAATERLLKPLTRVFPVLETPFARFLGASAIDAPLNVGASAAARYANGEPVDMTPKSIATDLAFSLLAGGHAYEAAKQLPTARSMADGSHPEIMLMRSIAGDSSVDRATRRTAFDQANRLQAGGKAFVEEFTGRSEAAPAEHLEALDRLRELDALPDGPRVRDERAETLETANRALTRMVSASREATEGVVRALVRPHAVQDVARVIFRENPADPGAAVLARLGQRAIESGAIDPRRVKELETMVAERVPEDSRAAVLQHAVGASVYGETFRSVLEGEALDDPAINLGYLRTLQEAGVVMVSPEGRTKLNLQYAFLLPKAAREQLARNHGEWADVPEGAGLRDVARIVREGHTGLAGAAEELAQRKGAEADPGTDAFGFEAPRKSARESAEAMREAMADEDVARRDSEAGRLLADDLRRREAQVDRSVMEPVTPDMDADISAGLERRKSARVSAGVMEEAFARAERERRPRAGDLERLNRDLRERESRGKQPEGFGTAVQSDGSADVFAGLPKAKSARGSAEVIAEGQARDEAIRRSPVGAEGLRRDLAERERRSPAPVSHEFESKSGSRYVRRGGAWFKVNADGSETRETNGFKVSAAEKGKVEVGPEALSDGKVVFSRGDGTPGKRVPKEKVQRVLESETRRWPNRPEFEVVQGYDDLPGAVRDEYRRKGVEAFYDSATGKVTIIADQMRSAAHVVQTALHEMVGHHGLRGAFGDRLPQMLDRLAVESGGHVAETAKRLGLDIRDPAQRREAAEEFLAGLTSPRLRERVVRWLKEKLQKVFPGIRFEDDYVRSLLRAAQEFVKGEGSAAQREAAVRFSKSGDAPHDEVYAPDGKMDWGEVTEQMARESKGAIKPGPIRLLNGKHFGSNKGFGLAHWMAEHGKDLEHYGFEPDQFLHRTLQNFTEIYDQGGGRFLLVAPGKPRSFGVVELRLEKGGFYSVVTAFPKDSAAARPVGRLVWRGRRAPARSSADQSSRTAQGRTGEPALKPPLEPLEDQTNRGKDSAFRGEVQPNSFNARGMKGETRFSKSEEKPVSEEEKFFVGPEVEHGLRGLRRLFDGAADVLERTRGLEGLGKLVRKHIDKAREVQGKASAVYAELYRKEGKAAFNQAEKEVEAYFKEKDRDPAAAERARGLMSAEGRRHIETWEAIASRFADWADRLGVKVEMAEGGWRKMGRIEGYHPRMIHPEFREAIMNPKGNPKKFKEAVRIMMEEGFGKNVEEVMSMFKQAGLTGESGTDFFGNVERARELKLPNRLYDYSFEARRRYIMNAAERMAQIEAYGQSRPGHLDAFEQYVNEKGTRYIYDKRTRDYVAAVARRAYGKTPRDMLHRTMAVLNSIATGTMLSNPVTVMTNLASGLGYNATTLGIRNSLKALAEVRRYGDLVAEAREKGVILDDLMGLHEDAAQLESSTVSKIQKATSAALKWSGFEGSENFVRAMGLATARNFLNAGLRAWTRNPEGQAARKFEAFVRRNGVDPEALLRENGEGKVTDRFFRAAVNAGQGGYRIDQVPVYMDSPAGRFLMKYQKWGAQATRNFAKNVAAPLIGRGGPVDAAPLARYLLVTTAIGAGLAALKEEVFGSPDKTASMEEIMKTWPEDGRRAVALAAEKLFGYQILSGAYGMAGNYAQVAGDVMERSRFKNPLEPPGVASLTNAGDMFLRAWEQGTLTWKDAHDYLKSQISAYRTGMAAAGRVGLSVIEQNRENAAWLNVQTRRFAEELGVPANRTSFGRFGKTEDSPVLRDLNDALLSGDVATAREKISEYVSRAPTAEARAARLKSLRQSVRMRQPVKVGSAGEARREMFLSWAKKRLPEEDFQRVREIDRTYRTAAIRTGVFSEKPVTDRQRRATLAKLQSR